MVKSSKGIRKRTRGIMRKKPRTRGMPPVTHSLQSFESGEKADIVIDSAVHGGQPHVRFHGFTGVVNKMQGRSYLVDINVGGKKKQVVAGPEHLRKQRG